MKKIKTKENNLKRTNKVGTKLTSNHAITLISLVITIIILIILAGVAINMALGKNGILNKARQAAEKYKIEQIRETVEIAILDVEMKELNLGNEVTIELVLQELLDNNTFETIDKIAQIGNINEYDVKLKYNENNKVVIESIQKATGIRITYELEPSSYTNQEKVNILFKVQGKVKSVKKPDGLVVYPKNDTLAVDYEVNSNGIYKFIVEENGKEPQEKEVVVDIIDTLPPTKCEITAEDTKIGMKVTATAEDAEASETSVKSVKSGIERYEYYVKLETESNYTKYDTNEIELPAGTYKVYAVAYDKAGNPSANSNEVTVKVEEWIKIYTEQQLRDVANALDRNYVLMNDIVLTEDWEPLGNSTTPFTGKFDGDNCKISELKIENSEADNQGLFGTIGGSSKVRNLKIDCNITGRNGIGALASVNYGTVENVIVSGTVTGYSTVGGLVGTNSQGTITSTYSSVIVTGQQHNIGGLVGSNYNGGSLISKSASSGTVTSLRSDGESIGGLVGSNFYASIVDSYSTGSVTGNACVGGIVGNNNGSTITNSYTISKVTGNRTIGAISGIYGNLINSYWIEEMVELSTTGGTGGTSTTVTYMIKKSNLEDKFDFEKTWEIQDGESLPYLKGLPVPEELYVIKNGYTTFEQGTGTEEDPFIIKTEEDLKRVRKSVTSHYKIAQDIILTEDWTPIGSTSAFTGKLDGDNHKISGLKIENSAADNQGLFGVIGAGGKVSNLKIDCDITGRNNVGGLVGVNYGTIENIKISGNVTGFSTVGGLIGDNEQGTITGTYSSVTVLGQQHNIGGLIGYNKGSISKSASTGTVTSLRSDGEALGGLVGSNFYANIVNSYSTGDVIGNYYVGGLVGNCNGSTITNSYTISKVTGNSGIGAISGIYGNLVNSYWNPERSEVSTGGGTGGTSLTLEQMKTRSSYVGWDFESGTVWKMEEFPELVFSFSIDD